ncbi:3-octaprenyl-4-hydroxybenzoate carboxy-lyase [Polystyrenella longa]|uniref:3-octaprenyl-4-hydroxybenzoate carboxy-lyase n=1 Tax=Polystyrenella longa TaxID=2528007 RepID=A0A518CK25_9PLAN|nr:UbiD family decarboxylase domain-containing protein [Polystyrenella longa]QDU79570.1 3-octaprenyl-4-hydroxybenzoate carboxy-lyase [Polystyrenella longa]
MFANLTTFLRDLEERDDLHRISTAVDPQFELGEIIRQFWSRQPDQAGPAILFEKVSGFTFPIVANLLGTESRLCRALRVESLDELGSKALHLFQPNLPVSMLGSLKLMPQLGKLTHLSPKTVSQGSCQQVVNMGRELNLLSLPAPQFYPHEAGPLINAGQLYTQTPDGRTQHIGSYPVLIIDERRLAVLWRPTDQLETLHKQYQAAGQPLPFAITVGGDPVSAMMAHFPILFGLDPLAWGGFLKKKSYEIVPCHSNKLKVSAESEFVIEGFIPADPQAIDQEGIGLSFGENGYSGIVPVAEATAITHASKPTWHTTVWGENCPEEFWMRKATERTMLPLIRLFHPELTDLNLVRSGYGRFILFFSFRKSYAYQARNLMSFLWSLPPFQDCRYLIAVDENIDVQQENQVWHQFSLECHPGRDSLFQDGPTEQLHGNQIHGNHSVVNPPGNRIGFDATRKRNDEAGPLRSDVTLSLDPHLRSSVKQRLDELGL